MPTDKDYFAYNPGDVPKEDFKISPSQMSRFFDNTSEWYREMFLGEKTFLGNTASVLGTAVHGLAAMYKEKGHADYALAENFVRRYEDPEGAIDKNYILRQFPVMYRELESRFLNTATGTAELFFKEELLEGIWLGGSLDLVNDEEVIDFKTTSALSAPTAVKRSYYFQQMCYVWLARKAGYPVKRFRLVYVTTNQVGRISETTKKAMKDYPTTVSSIVHEVRNEDISLIEGAMKLVADSVKAWKEYPELRHVLAQDYRLKEEAKAVSIFNK